MSAAEKVEPADAFSQGDVLQGRYTVEQFLAWMRIRPERFELHGDRIVCTSGTKKEHREAVRALCLFASSHGLSAIEGIVACGRGLSTAIGL